MTNFKKVFDYQKNILSGHVGYYELNSKQRKDFHLPPSFAHEIFHDMELWEPTHRAVNPRHGQVSNTSNPSPEEEANNDGEDQSEDHETDNGQTQQADSSQVPSQFASVQLESPLVDANGQRKNRAAKIDDHFHKSTNNLLEAMKLESDKWAEHDTALLAWDKEKHTILVGLELKMHKESLIVEECMGTEISGALKEVSSSFKYFIDIVARRLQSTLS